jgi:hypothetical protein
MDENDRDTEADITECIEAAEREAMDHALEHFGED